MNSVLKIGKTNSKTNIYEFVNDFVLHFVNHDGIFSSRIKENVK